MGKDWERLTAAYVATRTMRERVLGDTSGAGTTGIDEAYAAAYFEGVGAEIMGAGMFGLHSFPDDPDWKGWWGDRPPFGAPVYRPHPHGPRPSIPMDGGTTFHFRSTAIEDVLAGRRRRRRGRRRACRRRGQHRARLPAGRAWSTSCTSRSPRS